MNDAEIEELAASIAPSSPSIQGVLSYSRAVKLAYASIALKKEGRDDEAGVLMHEARCLALDGESSFEEESRNAAFVVFSLEGAAQSNLELKQKAQKNLSYIQVGSSLGAEIIRETIRIDGIIAPDEDLSKLPPSINLQREKMSALALDRIPKNDLHQSLEVQ